MSLDPASIHGERYTRVGEIIERDMEVIVRRWQHRCGEVLTGSRDDDQRAGEHRVREFLEALAVQLISTRRHADEAQETAADLGGFRWSLGWDLRQVVREYLLLRLILLDHLEQECENPLTREELLAISLNFDEAIAAAVTAYAEHEERVRDDYERELEISNRELTRFAHVVAHELKSPLNAQLMGIELLERQLGDATAQEDLRNVFEMARNSVQDMASLINELLRYAELGSGELELRQASCRDLVETALHHLRNEIASTGARIEYGDLPTVTANAAGLTLLFQNLIGNAIHYRREAPPEIRIEAYAEQREWRFIVSDNGAGIAAEDHSRIFDMFSRAHENLRPEGTGIGLAMCRRIVEEHGGRIWVESQPGIGSRFLFTIPATFGAAPAVTDPVESLNAP